MFCGLVSTGVALGFCAMLLGGAFPARAAGPECEPRRRALVLGIDGARGDVLDDLAWKRGTVPALRDLMARGIHARCPDPASAECARAHPGPRIAPEAAWVTAPGWASVLSGVDARRHGVIDNSPASLARYARTARLFPSFLMRARATGLETAAGGVGAFLTSVDGEGVYPGVLDHECAETPSELRASALRRASCNLSQRLPLDSRDPGRDAKLVAWLIERAAEPRADALMGVLDQVDEAGHRHGFGSRSEYIAAFRAADALIGPLVAELERGVATRCEAWLVIVTADHGGHARFLRGGAHGQRPGTDDAIPFSVTVLGPSAPLIPLRAPVTQMDVHPTVMHWLGLPLGSELDGRVQGIRGSPGRSSSVNR
jgi:hypothetical protein